MSKSGRVVPLLAIGAIVVGVAYWLSTAIKTAPADEPADKAVNTIPYLGSIPDGDPREGVIEVDEQRAQPGLTLMTSSSRRKTYLVDLDGTVVHTWKTLGGAYATVDDEGNLYAEQGGLGLSKYDWGSEQRWNVRFNSHHDVWLDQTGNVITLDRAPIGYQGPVGSVPIVTDWIVVLSPAGEVLRRISLLPCAAPLIPKKRFEEINAAMLEYQKKRGSSVPLTAAQPDSPYDVFHTNSVAKVERTIEGVAEPGDFLVSIRELHLIAIIRPLPEPTAGPGGGDSCEMVWTYEGDLSYQHHASLLDDDHIMVFDNGREHEASRVLEIDPKTQQVVWTYDGTPAGSLYSGWRGSAQRLPNGNTLVADSDSGRVVEVTPKRDVVWEYLMHRKGPTEREPVYRAIRLTGEKAAALRALP